ncbi:hypothetical protein ACFLZS_01590 [Patescibacteria group bacterium]
MTQVFFLDWHKNRGSEVLDKRKRTEINHLKKMFLNKSANWRFIYIDFVRREVIGKDYSRLKDEDNIKNLLKKFDERIGTSRYPSGFPMRIFGDKDIKIFQEYQSFAENKSVSKKDAIVISDSILYGCKYLITTDGKLMKNKFIIDKTFDKYSLKIVWPSKFIEEKCL